MSLNVVSTVARELSLSPQQVDGALRLFDEGNTLPFIARYRKEVTGGLDDGQLRLLAERLSYLRELDARFEWARVHRLRMREVAQRAPVDGAPRQHEADADGERDADRNRQRDRPEEPRAKAVHDARSL